MDFDSMAIFYLIPILEIVEKTPSRGLHPTTWLAWKWVLLFVNWPANVLLKSTPHNDYNIMVVYTYYFCFKKKKKSPTVFSYSGNLQRQRGNLDMSF